MIKVVFDEAFCQVYDSDPAAEAGRMEAIVNIIEGEVEFVEARPATAEQIGAIHTEDHMAEVVRQGIYEIAALAAGATIQAAGIGLGEPCLALVRPPGHHASADDAWGFCHFNNMAIALQELRQRRQIDSALVLDIDLHYGDGTVNILGNRRWVRIENPSDHSRQAYMSTVERLLADQAVDMIGISAGFDAHLQDWGRILATEDYTRIGSLVRRAARRSGGGCFAALEGGYNHKVLGQNVLALLRGLSQG